MSGDFTQRARAKQYKNAMAFMRRLPMPQLVVPGNHDIPLFNLFGRFFCPLRNYHKYVTKRPAPGLPGRGAARHRHQHGAAVHADARRVLEGRQDLRGTAARHQAALLRRPAERVQDRRHAPPVHPAAGRAHARHRPRRQRALDQMEECNIDMCLAGHLHMGYSGDVRTHHEAVKRSIISVQAGTATSTRRRGNRPSPTPTT